MKSAVAVHNMYIRHVNDMVNKGYFEAPCILNVFMMSNINFEIPCSIYDAKRL